MPCNSRSSDYNFLTLLFLVLSSAALAAASGFACLPGSPRQAQAAPRESLETAAKQFIESLKKADADAMVEQFSKKGVVFGIDSDTIPLKQIKKEMKKDGALYCLFFDTQCLRKDPSFRQEYALRDILMKGKSYRLQIGFKDESWGKTGLVTLYIEGNPDRVSRGEEFCEVGYIFEEGAWKISEVQNF